MTSHGILSVLLLSVAATWLLGCSQEEQSTVERTSVSVSSTDPQDVAPPEHVTVPPGMVYVPGGRSTIGSEQGLPHERPVFQTRVDAYFMDVHPVTVGQFREFVEAAGYVTEAERFGDAGILHPETRQWTLAEGAYWRYPLGPEFPAAAEDHPVTQVSWNDAAAYAEWAGKRLPTEIEWEHAARGAVDSRDRYAWGSELVRNGRFMANTWQGQFPVQNTMDDGYFLTSPVGEFGHSPLGLTDMGGNVWEWTADWYRSYGERHERYQPDEESEKSQRGGSFLCHPSYCHGYRVSARAHATPETSLFHVGFRLVKDLE